MICKNQWDNEERRSIITLWIFMFVCFHSTFMMENTMRGAKTFLAPTWTNARQKSSINTFVLHLYLFESTVSMKFVLDIHVQEVMLQKKKCRNPALVV